MPTAPNWFSGPGLISFHCRHKLLAISYSHYLSKLPRFTVSLYFVKYSPDQNMFQINTVELNGTHIFSSIRHFLRLPALPRLLKSPTWVSYKVLNWYKSILHYLRQLPLQTSNAKFNRNQFCSYRDKWCWQTPRLEGLPSSAFVMGTACKVMHKISNCCKLLRLHFYIQTNLHINRIMKI